MEDLNWRTRCYGLQDINNQLEKENQQYRQQIRDLKEELETEQNLNDSERTIVIPELENRIKQYKQQIDELKHKIQLLQMDGNLEVKDLLQLLQILKEHDKESGE